MTKEELRREARARLRALRPEDRERAAAEIAGRVWAVPEIAGARTLLVYAALPGEVPTAGISAEARRRGMSVIYPRCLPEGRELVLHHVDGEARLVPGSYGILEPHADCPVTTVEEVDAALVPGLAWDREGGRLGRGAGYYDRLLGSAGWRAARIGLFWEAQEAPGIPMDPWDVPLDLIVTERGVWRPRG